MWKSKIVKVVSAAVLLVLVVVVLMYLGGLIFPKKSNKVIGSREVNWGQLRIRITAFSEVNSFDPGAYYVFETIDGSNNSSEIMTFRHDEPVPINDNSIRILNDGIAYVYMGWMYGVTIDSGRTWSIWDASKELSNWKCCNYGLINDIRLNEDGTGEMRLSDSQNNIAEVLYTTDFGKTWNSSH
jgi:hypothetical protein